MTPLLAITYPSSAQQRVTLPALDDGAVPVEEPTKHPLGLLAAFGRDLSGRSDSSWTDVHPVAASCAEYLSEDDVAQLLREVRVDQTAWLDTRGAADLRAVQAPCASTGSGPSLREA